MHSHCHRIFTSSNANTYTYPDSYTKCQLYIDT